MTRKFPISLILSITLFCSCGLFETSSQQLVDFLPRETDVPGWIIMGKTVASSNNEIGAIKNLYGFLEHWITPL